MDLIVICLVAFLAAILTFFPGFGLGTILMPVFAIFFPADITIVLGAGYIKLSDHEENSKHRF